MGFVISSSGLRKTCHQTIVCLTYLEGSSSWPAGGKRCLMKNHVNSAIKNNILSYTPVWGDEFESEPKQGRRGYSKVQNLELKKYRIVTLKIVEMFLVWAINWVKGISLGHLFGMLLFNIMRRKNIVCEATDHHHLDGSNLWTRTKALKLWKPTWLGSGLAAACHRRGPFSKWGHLRDKDEHMYECPTVHTLSRWEADWLSLSSNNH